jgi:YidC/Oxa1 family membrane protein insertase
MSTIIAAFASMVDGIADLLQPFAHTSAVAIAIILFTACVRLAIHPLSRATARGQKARSKLAPQVAELRRKYGKDPARMQKAVADLYAKEKVSPLTGCLPMLLQLPAFYLMYRVFYSGQIGGAPNALLHHSLFGAPLGGRWTSLVVHGAVFSHAGLVYLVLFAIIACVAVFNYRRTKKQTAAAAEAGAPTASGRPGTADQDMPGAGMMAGLAKVMPLMYFVTLITAAVVPLAAALYVVTSTTWSAAERYFLYRDMPVGSAPTTADTPVKSAPTTGDAPVGGAERPVAGERRRRSRADSADSAVRVPPPQV